MTLPTPEMPEPPKPIRKKKPGGWGGYDPIIACLKRGETAERWQDRDVRDCKDIIVLLQDILLELRR